ncbi:uncharacterized protein N7477_005322 [Penicillium maclennaniae]|uniref:uncharacterized protein n=1 Tax=Penicillium maclennaniae TaxID=1343394 RepID=UPI00254246B6|nr:uncharacterized protein N7477_005322 [Penicillium maclennaniae]KAJ5669959.1 hypothetical protein N7477_005322 [Penicillium maclennaniae]
MTTEYTVERFQRAVKAFSQPASQPQPDDAASLIEPKPHYYLRQRDKAKSSTLGQAWIDNDTTKTYDPVEDSPRSKRKLRPEQRHGNSSKSRKRHQTFCSDSLESSIEKAEQQKRESEEESSLEKELDLSTTSDYNLRTRNRPSESPVKTGKMDYKTETGGVNSAAFSHAHSACVACRELGIECSLVEDPFYYPCQDCRQDELECKLDPPALWKRACEGCKKHREPCSYSSGGYDHSQPCRWCTEHGFDCIAGPAKRQPPCAEGQSRQSNLQMVVEIPQSSMDGVAENIFDISLSYSSLADLAHEPIEKSRPSNLKVHTQTRQGSDAQSDITLQSKICVIMGQTSPLNTTSAWTPEAASSSPGGLTFQPPNGLPPSLTDMSHSRPEPTGVYHDPYTGQRYTYTGATEPSRMCINCTIDRVAILKCAHSKIERVPGLPLNNLEICAAFEELAEASMGLKAGSMHAGEPFPSPGYPWCCICQEPASYECTDPQASTSSELSLDDYVPTVGRCGLRLCDYCAHYAKLYRGDLDAVYKRGADDPNNKTAFRADVALILKRSPNEEFVHSG